MLEAVDQLAHGAGELAVDGVARGAGRCCVVGLVEDQERARSELVQQVAQARGVGLVGQKPVRDDEARAGVPGIDAEAAAPAELGQPLTIDNREAQAELGLQLVLPLQRHRRRCRDDDEVDAPAQEQLAQHEPGLDGLAQADIVGDQEIDPRQPQPLGERCKLIVLESDAGPKGSLKKGSIGRAGGAPLEGAEKGGEDLGIVSATCAQCVPCVLG